MPPTPRSLPRHYTASAPNSAPRRRPRRRVPPDGTAGPAGARVTVGHGRRSDPDRRPCSPLTARKTWRTVEPLHGMIYFAPEAAGSYAAPRPRPGQPGTSPRARPPWGRSGPTRSSPPSSTSARRWSARPSPGPGSDLARRRCSRPGSRRPTPPCAACSATPSTPPRWSGRPPWPAGPPSGPPTATRAGRCSPPTPGSPGPSRPPGAVARPDPAARVPGRRAHRRAGRCTTSTRWRPWSCTWPPASCPGVPAGLRGWPDADWDAGVARLGGRGLVEPAARRRTASSCSSDGLAPPPGDRGRHRPAGRLPLRGPRRGRLRRAPRPWPARSAATVVEAAGLGRLTARA